MTLNASLGAGFDSRSLGWILMTLS